MANTIVLKYKSASGAPAISDLVPGELALNITDSYLYAENVTASGVVRLNSPPALADTITGARTFSGAFTLDGVNAVAATAPTLSTHLVNKEYIDTTRPATAVEYSKTQNFNATALTPGASIAWNLEENQVATIELDQNSTLAQPSNQVAGATYILIVKQPVGANYTLAFHSDYKFPGGTDPVITPTNGAVDVLGFVSDGTSMFGNATQDFS